MILAGHLLLSYRNSYTLLVVFQLHLPRRSNSKFNPMLNLSLCSTKSPTQSSKKSTSIKAFPWHIWRFPRSSYDCLTGPWLHFSDRPAALLLSAARPGSLVEPEGSLRLLAALCSASASLPGSHCLLPSLLPLSADICKMQLALPDTVSVQHLLCLCPGTLPNHIVCKLSSSLAV